MDQVDFGYSLKNIPIPEKKVYLEMLIDSSEKVLRTMRWKAYHFFNPSQTKSKAKETYGFNSTKPSPNLPELKDFQDGLLKIIENIKFNKNTNEFQNTLKKDSMDIKSEEKVYLSSDKTDNFYKIDPVEYNKLLENNITANYKKSSDVKFEQVTSDDVNLTKLLEIDDRVYKTTKRQAFVTLKDHKPNFRNNPKCRLLNPTKTELGRVSKQKTDKINSILREKLGFNQWRNTKSAVKWYINLRQKHKLSFIQLDVDGFYGSISEKLFLEALEWAEKYVDISDEDKKILIQSKKSFLFHKDRPWEKKGEGDFNITEGSLDGAESCEFIGLYLLSQLQDLGIDIGIYRDDGLAVSKFSARKNEQIKQKIVKIFENNNLKITITANLKVVDFLDVTFDLNTGIYKPFTKPNHTPKYVNKKSNHPPNVTKNIPEGVNQRLSENSSNEEVFKQEAPIYQEALKKSGYDYTLKFTPQNNPNPETKIGREEGMLFGLIPLTQ